jgi:hypothetical protein
VTSILVQAYGFVVVDELAASDAVENFELLAAPISWDQYLNRLADDFLGRVPEELFRSPVPGSDGPVEIDAQDRIVGCLNDCGRNRLARYGR